MKNKKTLLFIIISFVIVLIGSAIAYLTSTDLFENIFQAGIYKTITREEFTPPTNWMPGDYTEKTVTTKNEGTIPVRVRVKLDSEWFDSDDQSMPNYFDGIGEIAQIDCDFTNWIIAIDREENCYYFYYEKELAPGESTTSLLKGVLFNPSYDGNIVCTQEDGGTTSSCEGTGSNYMNSKFVLTITTETVQANKYQDAWGNAAPVFSYTGEHPCSTEDELVDDLKYENGQYVYTYSALVGGWSVELIDKDSTDPVNSILCSSINNKPIISMNGLFSNSRASSIDLSSFDTSNVMSMIYMFSGIINENLSLDLSNFDTSRVYSFDSMFKYTTLSNLNISGFDFSNLNYHSGEQLNIFNYAEIGTITLNNIDCEYDLFPMHVSDNIYMNNANYGGTLVNIRNFDNIHNSTFPNILNLDHYYSDKIANKIDLTDNSFPNLSSMFSTFFNSNIDEIDISNFDLTNIDVFNMLAQSTIGKVKVKDEASARELNASFGCDGIIPGVTVLPDVYVGNTKVDFYDSTYYTTAKFENYYDKYCHHDSY